MTYKEKRDWLFRYRDSLRCEEELVREVERLRSEAARVTPLLSVMPGGGGDGQTLPRVVEQIVDAQENLQAQVNRCGAIRREIVAVLEQVTNARDHEIMRRRYILGQRWEYIAVVMKMDLRWVYRRHKQTVEGLTIESH